MKNNPTLLRRLPFFLFMLALCFPLCYQFSELYWVEGLKGYQAAPERVDVTWENLKMGRYQDYAEQRLLHELRLKPFFIRLDNELRYQLFGEFTLPDISQGREGWLYNPQSIEVWKGEDRLNLPSLEEKMEGLAHSIEKLRQNQGPELLFLLAPSKAAVYPEYLPENVGRVRDSLSSYYSFIRLIRKYNIPHLDTYPLFLEWKKQASNHAFTKGGVHWSQQASYEVWDTLYRRVEEMTCLDLPDYSYGEPVHTQRPNERDRDLADAANLLFSSLVEETYVYPKVEVEESGERPKVLVIGDSFFWNFHRDRLPHRFFSENFIFWYYFQKAYGLGENYWTEAEEIPDFSQKIEESDLILFVVNITNFQSCCWGSIEELNRIVGKEK